MARPRKSRKVCELPSTIAFGPKGNCDNKDVIVLYIDEYETIRLIDYEGLNQEECSASMEIARTTVQQIYNEARKKLATAIVEGKHIQIRGGNYKICNGQGIGCKSGCCKKNTNTKNRKETK